MNAEAVESIKILRQETGASFAQCKEALEEAIWILDDARQILREKGYKGKDLSSRATKEGRIVSYMHPNFQAAALIEIRCETDFVSRTDVFMDTAKDLAMFVTAFNPSSTEELFAINHPKQDGVTIGEWFSGVRNQLGENLQIHRYVRWVIE